MKRKHSFTFAVLLIAATCLCSCRSAMNITQSVTPIETAHITPNSDFIGFKNLPRSNILTRDFGAELERRNIANNHQHDYTGGYNLTELSLAESAGRYITFVDVVAHNYTPNDAIDYNYNLEVGAWLVAGITAFTLFPVYVPMLIIANPNRTLLQLTGNYTVCIYDTREKRIAQAYHYEIDLRDKHQGEYYNKHTDRIKVDAYYRQKLYNLLIEGFDRAYEYIEQHP